MKKGQNVRTKSAFTPLIYNVDHTLILLEYKNVNKFFLNLFGYGLLSISLSFP